MSRFFLPLTLLTLLALQPSWCWAAETDPRIGQAEERIEAWRLAEAQEIVAALLSENPRSAEALDLSARVHFYQGRYDEALKLHEQALAIDAKNDRRQALRLFAQRTLDTLKKLKRFESHARLRGKDTRGGLETFSMLMLDYDYNGEVFDMDAVFYAHQLV